MIEARGLTKRYGDSVAVDNLSFDVTPGIITGFLGPNGSGKSTTMRMILGLDNPTSGSVTVNGMSYRDLPAPMHEVASLLDAKAVHGGRTARQHLRWVAQAAGIPLTRATDPARSPHRQPPGVGVPVQPASSARRADERSRAGPDRRGRCSEQGRRPGPARHAAPDQDGGAGRDDGAPPRRFVPARDGYWDGFAYEIDPALAADVATHREGLASNE